MTAGLMLEAHDAATWSVLWRSFPSTPSGRAPRAASSPRSVPSPCPCAGVPGATPRRAGAAARTGPRRVHIARPASCAVLHHRPDVCPWLRRPRRVQLTVGRVEWFLVGHGGVAVTASQMTLGEAIHFAGEFGTGRAAASRQVLLVPPCPLQTHFRASSSRDRPNSQYQD